MDTRAIQIYERLFGHGIVVHQVTPADSGDPDEFRVTLEANRCEHEAAAALLRSMPGVRRAEINPACPAFLAVLVRPEP